MEEMMKLRFRNINISLSPNLKILVSEHFFLSQHKIVLIVTLQEPI